MLFSDDNHSLDDIPFKKIDLDSEIAHILTSNYDVELNYQNINLIGNVNVNSQNFSDGNYYIKIINNAEKKSYALTFSKITESLDCLDIPCANFIKNRNHDFISYLKESDQYFLVQEFISGSFFNGSKKHLEESLRLLKKLRALSSININGLRKSPYLSFEPKRLLNKFEDKLSTVDDSKFNQLVLSQLPNLKGKLRYLESTLEYLTGETYSVNHFDLHPHNLIFKENSLAALVDLESFLYIQAEVSESFALYKLGRKSISKGFLSVEEFKKLCTEHGFDLLKLKPFVESELLRRIFLILELHLLQSNSEWNADFSKHLNSLKEIELMFN